MLSLVLFTFLLNLLITILEGKSLPSRVLGFYIPLADDTTSYTSDYVWQPSLYNYQISGANLLWFAFINPQTMEVPYAFSYLTGCKGQSGCLSTDQLCIFSIGGIGYSSSVNEWPWLSSSSSALSMAQTVANWATQYNIDGIDIDMEIGSASSSLGNNLITFVEQLKTLSPNMIVTVAVWGYPYDSASNMLISYAYNSNNVGLNLVNSVGIMVYDDTQSLQYSDYYSNPSAHGVSNMITSSVPTNNIMVGLEGTASSSVITTMANSVVQNNLKGILVWSSSSENGLQYGSDASTSQSPAWATALNTLAPTTTTTTTTKSPTTTAPTNKPTTTAAPTNKPTTTASPTGATTNKPVTTTASPTATAAAPTNKPTTVTPTNKSVTITASPTAASTNKPTTAAPTNKPATTTASPTAAPTTTKTPGKLPKRVLGFYIPLADDTTTPYTSDYTWQPSLYNYVISGANLLWFSSINPQTVKVPYAFSYLTGCKGQSGCPSTSQYCIYSIGGETYTSTLDNWPWLKSSSDAMSMAQTVSTWTTKYNIDGIDIFFDYNLTNSTNSTEDNSDSNTIGQNLIVFIKQLKSLSPNMIITIGTYGYPEDTVTNMLISYAYNNVNLNLINSIDIMYFDGVESLNYYTYYSNPTFKGTSDKITASVPTNNIMVGLPGSTDSNTILSMANSVIQDNLKGIVVWDASVFDKTHNQKVFTSSPDASTSQSQTWKTALSNLLQ